MLPHIEYLLPDTVEEVYRLLAEAGAAGAAMAGGTDLVPKMKAGAACPERVVGLKRVAGLNQIRRSPDGDLLLGATALLADVAGSELIAYEVPAVAEAAADTGTPQVRNMGTVVGNLCNAAPSADNVPCLLALEARVSVSSVSGSRDLPLTGFFLGPGATLLQAGEIVTQVTVPKPKPGSGLSYKNLSARGRVDIAAASAAALLRVEDGVCREARIVLGGVAPVPLPVPEAGQLLLGGEPSPDRLAAAAALAAAACSPICDVRANAEYRRHLVGILAERALAQALARALGAEGRPAADRPAAPETRDSGGGRPGRRIGGEGSWS